MRTLLALALLLAPAAAGELEDLKAENARLTALLEKLEAQLEGTAKPINLARTSLASVSVSSVNGGRSLANTFYGVLNLFDDGTNWHNGINYTSWLSSGEPEPWVDVHFDEPVVVHAVEVDGGPTYRVRLFYAGGGEETADLRTPKAGVRAVRIAFDAGERGGNVQVREIRVLGHAPEGVAVEARAPRIALGRSQALGVARERFEEWRQGLFPGLREERGRRLDGRFLQWRPPSLPRADPGGGDGAGSPGCGRPEVGGG